MFSFSFAAQYQITHASVPVQGPGSSELVDNC